ncbi:MAG TPA: MFS transporter [Blastocatellia bacterium]|nr:MFS transporter [Blastocatellia bacterium]
MAEESVNPSGIDDVGQGIASTVVRQAGAFLGAEAALDAPRPVTSDISAEPWPSPARAWYAVFIFALSLMINFLDRGILTLLVGPIKRDLHLSDSQMGLVMGFAFVCFYVILGLPIARLVDFKSRRAIIAVGVTIWSFMTAICGLARSFGQLFLFRIGVGVGEACTGPATYSMLSDLFPKEKLPRAIAFLNFGFYAGTGVALIIGGTVTQALSKMGPVSLPVIGTMYSWQMTFFVVGIPGLIVAALMSTVREPKRRGLLAGGTGRGQQQSVKPLPIREVLAFIRANLATYGPLFLGMGVQVVMVFGLASWGPAFYMRTYQWTPAKYGLILGVFFVTIMPVGAIVGSMLAERSARKGQDDANLRIVLLASVISIPGYVLSPLMPSGTLAVIVSAYALFCGAWVAGPINAALQVITPNQMRGQITALFLFVFNVIGFGFGPTLVGLITDHVFHAEDKIRYSMSLVALILGPLAAFVIWRGLRPYGRSVARSKDWA